jgi:peptidoglycan/xylan/chitin deacetylase (PgdA/CDA1 family)
MVREWIGRRRFSVIVYHDPAPDIIENHIRYLRRHYTIIPLQQMVDSIYARRRHALPRKSLVITIDDGHIGNYLLLNIFKRYSVKPTIYLCINNIGIRSRMGVPVNRQAESGKNEVNICLNRQLGKLRKFKYSEWQALSLSQIHDMKYWVDFQSHGKNHTSLVNCEEEGLQEELSDSKKELSKILGKNSNHFAYPFGDYTRREKKMAMWAGYKSARTTDPGWNNFRSDPFALKVVGMVPDRASLNMLCAQLSGLPNLVSYLVKRMRKPAVFT